MDKPTGNSKVVAFPPLRDYYTLFSSKGTKLSNKKMEKKKKRKWKSKRFNIFGDVWTIVFCDKTISYENKEDKEGHWVWGFENGRKKKIFISTVDEDGEELREEDILCTIAHECVHAILESGQYINSSQDEPMVEFLAKGILSLIKSKVFDYETEDLG